MIIAMMSGSLIGALTGPLFGEGGLGASGNVIVGATGGSLAGILLSFLGVYGVSIDQSIGQIVAGAVGALACLLATVTVQSLFKT